MLYIVNRKNVKSTFERRLCESHPFSSFFFCNYAFKNYGLSLVVTTF